VPPPALLVYLAQQLDVDAGAFAVYAQRDQTRRMHLAELTRRLGLLAFDRAAFHAMVDWALQIVPSMRDPEAIATLLVEEFRRRHILLPSIAMLELIVRTAQRRAEAAVQRALTEGLSGPTLAALERRVEAGPETVPSRLSWLRTASRSPAARNLLGLIERLDFMRGLGVPRTLLGAIPQIAFQRLVDEAMRMTAQHLAEATTSRRLALLVTVTLHLETALTDAALSMFDKLMGSLSRRAERRSEQQAARSAGDLRTRLRVLASSCRALIAARDADGDLEEAIELHMGWGRFIRVVSEAEAAAGPEAPDTKAELLSRYSTIRQFAPTLLDAFQFRGGRTAAGLLRAIGIMRELNRTGERVLPAHMPTGFIRRLWRPLVLRNGMADRRAYEVCVLCELRDRLRAGDVWVEGSRDYRDFEDTLIPRSTSDEIKAAGPLSLAVDMDGASHLSGWRDLLRERMHDVAALARSGMLPDVDLRDGTPENLTSACHNPTRGRRAAAARLSRPATRADH
jgi:hypothetical protein